MALRLECVDRDGEGGFEERKKSRKNVEVTYSVKSMGSARAGDEIRTHELRVVQEDGAVSARHEDGITIL